MGETIFSKIKNSQEEENCFTFLQVSLPSGLME